MNSGAGHPIIRQRVNRAF